VRSLGRPPTNRTRLWLAGDAGGFQPLTGCVRAPMLQLRPTASIATRLPRTRSTPALQLRVHVLRHCVGTALSTSAQCGEDSCAAIARRRGRPGVCSDASGFDPAVHLKWDRADVAELSGRCGTWRRRIGNDHVMYRRPAPATLSRKSRGAALDDAVERCTACLRTLRRVAWYAQRTALIYLVAARSDGPALLRYELSRSEPGKQPSECPIFRRVGPSLA